MSAAAGGVAGSSVGGDDDKLEEEVEVEVEGGTAGGNPRRCAACKYLRRRCARDCVLAPYFPAASTRRYACVHRVFGASNVARLLQSLPEEERESAAEAMAVEAEWRVRDPVYGCTGVIYRLQDEIAAVQCELARTLAQLAIVDVRGAPRHHHPPPPPALAPQHRHAPPPPPPPSQQQVVDDVRVARRHHALPPPPPPPPPPALQQLVDETEAAPALDPDDFLDLDGF